MVVILHQCPLNYCLMLAHLFVQSFLYKYKFIRFILFIIFKIFLLYGNVLVILVILVIYFAGQYILIVGTYLSFLN